MPKQIDEYVKKIKKQNPSYDDAKAYATAWSIFCAHKDPGNAHCQREPNEYFTNKKANARQVPVRDLPEGIQRVLKEVRYGRKDIPVHPGTSYRLMNSSGDGRKAFVAAVDLASNRYQITWGSWGGANINSPRNQVDLDDASRPIPPNGAIVEGSIGGNHPVYATVTVHPDNLQKLLPSGEEPELSPKEKSALNMIGGLTSAGRKDEFPRAGLGTYGPQNPFLKSLAEKGMVKITGTGVSITLAGKNYRLQNKSMGYMAKRIAAVWLKKQA